jgi:hypothetical protein
VRSQVEIKAGYTEDVRLIRLIRCRGRPTLCAQRPAPHCNRAKTAVAFALYHTAVEGWAWSVRLGQMDERILRVEDALGRRMRNPRV